MNADTRRPFKSVQSTDNISSQVIEVKDGDEIWFKIVVTEDFDWGTHSALITELYANAAMPIRSTAIHQKDRLKEKFSERAAFYTWIEDEEQFVSIRFKFAEVEVRIRAHTHPDMETDQ